MLKCLISSLGSSYSVLYFSIVPFNLRKQPLSLLVTADNILPRGMSAPQRQEFHIDDVNQCLHNKCGSQGVPNIDLFDFMFLLVDYGKVLSSSMNELKHNSNASSRQEICILQNLILTVLW